MMKIQLIINPPVKVIGFAFVYNERSGQPIIEGSMSLKAVKNGEKGTVRPVRHGG